MFKNLFKSKRQRELERETAIQRALTLHRQHAAKLQRHERDYMAKAMRAKAAGDKTNLVRLCQMVAQTVNERRAVESQLLHFETILQTRDKVKLFQEFATGMRAMAKSISEVFREFNAGDVLADVDSAMVQASQLETTMGVVLDRISASSPMEATIDGGISAADVERIVGQKESESQSNVDEEIEAGLKAIREALTKEPS